jgi:acylphosphatase
MLVARRYLISGRVQGVGFRYFVEDVARREGVHGHVRNLGDGRVEALIEGDAETVGRVEATLRQGPRGARVDGLEIEDVTPTARATGFRIRG